MNEIKVRGLIIREAPMGDKDKRLVMLTREMGKLSVLAKGALSPKSRWGAVSQLFCYGEYRLSRGRTFYYIQEAQLIETFYDIRQSLERLAYGAFMLETAETLCLDGMENQQLMRLLLRGLKALSRAAAGQESPKACAFIWRALAENGYYPDLASCRSCGRPLDSLPPGGRVWLDSAAGGLICDSCGAGRGSGYLEAGALRALRYILQAPEDKVYAFSVETPVAEQMEETVIRYLTEQTEKEYGSLDFIGNLKRQP